MRQTLAMVDELGQRQPRRRFFTNIFSPYPGSPIFPEAVRRGVREPGSLEEWAAFYPKIQVLPWLNGAPHARIQRIRDYVRIGYSASHMVVHRSRGLRAPVRRALRGSRAGGSAACGSSGHSRYGRSRPGTRSRSTPPAALIN